MILGAGIYSIIGQAAGIAAEKIWQGFVIAGVAALLTALSYAELATMYPAAGGDYIYLKNAFSKQRWFAASVGIIVAFAGCASAATVSLAFASYLQHFFFLPRLFVAASVLIFFTAVNIVGIKESGWINVIFTVIEVFGLILFIWLGMQNPKFGEALFTLPNFSTVSSAALIIFAYLGFENIVNLSEETIEPEKNIPRAIFLSLLISMIIYVLVSLAAVALMPSEQLAHTESALYDAAMITSKRLAGILGGIALFSTANTALIGLISTSRILYGISKDKSLPYVLSKTLTKRKTPWVAALVSLVITILLLPLGKVKTLASIASFSTMIAFISINVALIRLRQIEPKKERPFRIPFTIGTLPILPLLAIGTCIVFIFQFDRQIYIITLLAFACSAGIYLISQRFITKR